MTFELSIKHNVWSSTEQGNRKLDQAFKESYSQGPIYLFFRINSTAQFYGVAQMTSSVDFSKTCSLWPQNNWKGEFSVQWIFVKEISNFYLRHMFRK